MFTCGYAWNPRRDSSMLDGEGAPRKMALKTRLGWLQLFCPPGIPMRPSLSLTMHGATLTCAQCEQPPESLSILKGWDFQRDAIFVELYFWPGWSTLKAVSRRGIVRHGPPYALLRFACFTTRSFFSADAIFWQFFSPETTNNLDSPVVSSAPTVYSPPRSISGNGVLVSGVQTREVTISRAEFGHTSF